jgi:hypothetical protein
MKGSQKHSDQAERATTTDCPLGDSRVPVRITKEHWKAYSKELKDDYKPKPSAWTRRIKEFWQRDGDTWIEITVFTGRVNRRTKELVYRSLFYSVNLKIAYWDEPPTGATTIIWAHEGVRSEPSEPPHVPKARLGHC